MRPRGYPITYRWSSWPRQSRSPRPPEPLCRRSASCGEQGAGAGRSRAAFLVKRGRRLARGRLGRGRRPRRRPRRTASSPSASQKGDKVAILCRTRLEWTLADYALATIGAVVIPIYPTSSPAEIEFILRDSETKVLIAEDAEQLAKMDEFEIELPALERVIGIDVAGPGGTLADVEAAGRAYAAEHPDALGAGGRPGRPRRHADVPLHVGHDRQPEGLRAQPAQLRLDGRVGRAGREPLPRGRHGAALPAARAQLRPARAVPRRRRSGSRSPTAPTSARSRRR